MDELVPEVSAWKKTRVGERGKGHKAEDGGQQRLRLPLGK